MVMHRSSFQGILYLLALAPVCCLSLNHNGGNLYPQFYDRSCPRAQEIVQQVVAEAVAKEPRMAASLLRLLFHDCFVQGCDGSVLLDSSENVVSEKISNPNRDSLRGFEVIDEIKSALEKECPETVSCADIIALAARDSTILAGGPSWQVPLGRRDSTNASLTGSNSNIPPPTSSFQALLTLFEEQGLDVIDLVALSGSHTIGDARCISFKQRLYNQTGSGRPDHTFNKPYAAELRHRCPRSGGDENLSVLDYVSPFHFDNSYYKNILLSKGLLNSDQVLFTQSRPSMELVKHYAENNNLFFEQFAVSMVKLGNISPLTGTRGEIRKSCRKINA